MVDVRGYAHHTSGNIHESTITSATIPDIKSNGSAEFVKSGSPPKPMHLAGKKTFIFSWNPGSW